jgi:hypothetical protein
LEYYFPARCGKIWVAIYRNNYENRRSMALYIMSTRPAAHGQRQRRDELPLALPVRL